MKLSKLSFLLPKSIRSRKNVNQHTMASVDCGCQVASEMDCEDRYSGFIPRSGNDDIVYTVLASGVYPYKKGF